jgi:hypothetical protein
MVGVVKHKDPRYFYNNSPFYITTTSCLTSVKKMTVFIEELAFPNPDPP